MTSYQLLIGDPSYSSWSLRGWLAFKAFNIPVSIETTRFYQDGFAQDLKAYAPAKTVPVVKASDGSIWADSLTIIEELASRHPEAGLLPQEPVARAKARSLIAEMHSSFNALRSLCPMNTRIAYAKTPMTDELEADLERLSLLWSIIDDTDSPWLFSNYSAADAFYAPVAARIACYNLPVSEQMMNYVKAHLAHLPFRQFRAIGLTHAPQDFYKRDYPIADWPGPAPLPAKAIEATAGQSVNKKCPYSGEDVHYFLEIEGTIIGFCNESCRDKTVNDPEAWPDFMALLSAN